MWLHCSLWSSLPYQTILDEVACWFLSGWWHMCRPTFSCQHPVRPPRMSCFSEPTVSRSLSKMSSKHIISALTTSADIRHQLMSLPTTSADILIFAQSCRPCCRRITRSWWASREQVEWRHSGCPRAGSPRAASPSCSRQYRYNELINTYYRPSNNS